MTFQPIKAALDTLNVYPDGWENEPVKIEQNEPAPVEIQYDRKWVLLLTAPNQELKSFTRLTALSSHTPTVVYWPHTTTQVKVQNTQREQRMRALSIFPGMLFVSIALGNIPGYRPFREIEITPGVRSYLRNGQGYLAYISDKDMRRVEQIEVDKNCPAELHEKCPPKPDNLEVGQEVSARVDLVDGWRLGTVSKCYQDGSYNINIPELFAFERVTTMRLFANQVEAV